MLVILFFIFNLHEMYLWINLLGLLMKTTHQWFANFISLSTISNSLPVHGSIPIFFYSSTVFDKKHIHLLSSLREFHNSLYFSLCGGHHSCWPVVSDSNSIYFYWMLHGRSQVTQLLSLHWSDSTRDHHYSFLTKVHSWTFKQDKDGG